MQHKIIDLAGQALHLCPGLSVRRVARRLTQCFDRHLGQAGLTLSQFSVLTAILLLEDEATAAEVARQMDADRSTLSRELSLLQNRGLIETNQIKGRRRTLKLSSGGEMLYRGAWDHWQNAVNEVETLYGAERIQQTRQQLNELLTTLPLAQPDAAETTSDL